jgi:predicted transcriptional regulator
MASHSVAVRLEPQLYERLAQRAERQERSLSNLSRLAIKTYLEHQEQLEHPPKPLGVTVER